MVRNKRQNACFGAPKDFNESQLPMISEVGSQFLKTQIDLKLKNLNGNVTSHCVAKEVCNSVISCNKSVDIINQGYGNLTPIHCSLNISSSILCLNTGRNKKEIPSNLLERHFILPTATSVLTGGEEVDSSLAQGRPKSS